MTKEDLTTMVQEVLEEIQGAEPTEPTEPVVEETPAAESKVDEEKPDETPEEKPTETPEVEEGKPAEEPKVEEEKPEGAPQVDEQPVPVEPLNVDDIVTQVIEKLGEAPRQDPNTTVADESFKDTLTKIEESLTTSGEFTEEETALLDFILVNYDSINERVDKLLGVTPSQS